MNTALQQLTDLICTDRPNGHCRSCRTNVTRRRMFEATAGVDRGALDICPHGLTEKDFPPTNWRSLGPIIWEKIHRGAMYGDPKKFPALMREADGLLPGDCACRGQLARYISEHSIPTSTNLECHVWAVDLHNHVNETKENPTPAMSRVEGLKAWAFPAQPAPFSVG